MAAHAELEALTLDRATQHYKQKLAIDYAELVYDGKWFTPLREAMDGFVDVTQRHVTGRVVLSLCQGRIAPGQPHLAVFALRSRDREFHHGQRV